MDSYINNIKLFFLFIFSVFSFFSKTIIYFNKKKKTLFFKKKTLFFKKKYNIKTIISKRLSVVLKKRKTIKKKKKKTNGNFFFKKFFFKTMLFCRRSIKVVFFNKKKIRQKKLTREIQKKTKFFFYKNFTQSYSLLNILICGGFFLFPKDTILFIKNGFVYVNGCCCIRGTNILPEGSCISIQVFDDMYMYFIFFKKFLKRKVSLYKQNSWVYFKNNFLKKKNIKKFKKRKNPKFLFLLYLYKFNTPQYIEVDFFTLTITILKKIGVSKTKTHFLNKNFSWKLFQIYNFKKIN